VVWAEVRADGICENRVTDPLRWDFIWQSLTPRTNFLKQKLGSLQRPLEGKLRGHIIWHYKSEYWRSGIVINTEFAVCNERKSSIVKTQWERCLGIAICESWQNRLRKWRNVRKCH
jgi:hypothetical protein